MFKLNFPQFQQQIMVKEKIYDLMKNFILSFPQIYFFLKNQNELESLQLFDQLVSWCHDTWKPYHNFTSTEIENLH